VKAATIGIRTLADFSVWLKDHQQTCGKNLAVSLFHIVGTRKNLPPC
jgi:hypothetical protein